MRALQEEMRSELHRHLEQAGPPVGDPVLPVPKVHLDDLSREAMAEYLLAPAPVVVEGGAAACGAVRNWTLDTLAERCGDTRVPIGIGQDQSGSTTLAELAASLRDPQVDRGWYAHSLSDLFQLHPSLVDDLPTEMWAGLFPGGRFTGAQMMIGGRKTGTSWHCANGLNVFAQVAGQKAWWFVSPRHSPWMSGALHPKGIFGMTPIVHAATPSEQRDAFPLYGRIPRLHTVLGPGDCLVNPPWWWHGISNRSSETIGVAMRMHARLQHRANPVYTVCQNLAPHSDAIRERMLRDAQFTITDADYRTVYEDGEEAPGLSSDPTLPGRLPSDAGNP
jgi:hypothetical protein